MSEKRTKRTTIGRATTGHYIVEMPDLPWIMSVKVTNLHGSPQITDLQVSARGEAVAPITGEALRSLPLGAIRRMVVEWRAQEERARSAGNEFRDPAPAFAELQEARRPKGRPRQLTDAHYAEVATIYGASTTPRKAIAKRFNVSEPQASNYIRGARDRGLLEAARTGRPRKTRSTQAKNKR
jgi:hypothetical protein